GAEAEGGRDSGFETLEGLEGFDQAVASELAAALFQRRHEQLRGGERRRLARQVARFEVAGGGELAPFPGGFGGGIDRADGKGEADLGSGLRRQIEQLVPGEGAERKAEGELRLTPERRQRIEQGGLIAGGTEEDHGTDLRVRELPGNRRGVELPYRIAKHRLRLEGFSLGFRERRVGQGSEVGPFGGDDRVARPDGARPFSGEGDDQRPRLIFERRELVEDLAAEARVRRRTEAEGTDGRDLALREQIGEVGVR